MDSHHALQSALKTAILAAQTRAAAAPAAPAPNGRVTPTGSNELPPRSDSGGGGGDGGGSDEGSGGLPTRKRARTGTSEAPGDKRKRQMSAVAKEARNGERKHDWSEADLTNLLSLQAELGNKWIKIAKRLGPWCTHKMASKTFKTAPAKIAAIKAQQAQAQA